MLDIVDIATVVGAIGAATAGVFAARAAGKSAAASNRAADAATESAAATKRAANAATKSADATDRAADAATKSADATDRAADAAKDALKLAKLQEENRIELLKNQHRTKHIAELIAAFATVRALANDSEADRRNERIPKEFRSVRFCARVLASLDREGGAQYTKWLEEPIDGEKLEKTILGIVGPGGLTEARRGRLEKKMDALLVFQNELFRSMTDLNNTDDAGVEPPADAP